MRGFGWIGGLWPHKGERMLPAASALFLIISFPPLHLLLPPFVALVPFALFIHRLPPDREGAGAAMRGGAMLAALYFGVILYWLFVALVWFSKLAILAYLGSIAVLVVLSASFSWLFHRFYHRMAIPLWVALPVTWTALEWFRAHLPAQLSFPWLGLGTSLTGYPELVGMAEVIGARGVTFWLALVSGLVAYALILREERRSPVRAVVSLVTVLVLPMGWGAWRAATLETRPLGRVAVVQPNIPEHVKLNRQAALDSTFRSLATLMPRLEGQEVKLVVMPEMTFPDIVRGRPELARGIHRISLSAGAPIVFGAYGYVMKEDDRLQLFNSAFLVSSAGLHPYQYDKQYLVPFVERVPFLNPDWFRAFDYFGGLGVGKGPTIGESPIGTFGVLICYESTYAEAAREFRAAGADILLNITNDSWYGREPLYSRTLALWQHPAHMVMRAIENRIGVARAANTGISLFIDPVGRITSRTSLFEADLLVDTVFTTDIRTFYTYAGDLTGSGAALATFILFLVGWWRERRSA